MSVLTHLHLEMSSFHIMTKEKIVFDAIFLCYLFDLVKMAREYILSSFSHFLLVHTNVCLFASGNAIFPHMHTVKMYFTNHRMSILMESVL